MRLCAGCFFRVGLDWLCGQCSEGAFYIHPSEASNVVPLLTLTYLDVTLTTIHRLSPRQQVSPSPGPSTAALPVLDV